jgi:hypothetical protein
MTNKILPILNILATLAVLYLFKVYGALSAWWTRVFRESLDLESRDSTFHALADQIHIAAIVLLLLNLASAIAMLSGTSVSRRFTMCAVVCAALGLVLCLLISF